MVILQFNKLIRNKWVWGVFAVTVCAAFCFDDLFRSSGDRGEKAPLETLSVKYDAALEAQCRDVLRLTGVESDRGDRTQELYGSYGAAVAFDEAGVRIPDAELGRYIQSVYRSKFETDAEYQAWLQEKFGMTLTAIYSFVSKNAIPKKKVGIMVYYSKKHVDIAKGLIAPEEPKYYTIAEAMERFNLTRDQLYHYVKYHNIPRIKVGKYTKILRTELDKFFEPPKIE